MAEPGRRDREGKGEGGGEKKKGAHPSPSGASAAREAKGGEALETKQEGVLSGGGRRVARGAAGGGERGGQESDGGPPGERPGAAPGTGDGRARVPERKKSSEDVKGERGEAEAEEAEGRSEGSGEGPEKAAEGSEGAAEEAGEEVEIEEEEAPKKAREKGRRREVHTASQKPELDAPTARLLELRRVLKDRTPEFIRQEAYNYARLGRKWRRPRGTHSKMRHHLGYRINVASIGYGGPAASRGLHPSGFREVLVHNPRELDGVDPKREAVRMAHGVGGNKRRMIMRRAERMGIRVLNPLEEV
ncbi:MAG: 50S ribosomal protein L32e [Thermoplasmatota archaeon]